MANSQRHLNKGVEPCLQTRAAERRMKLYTHLLCPEATEQASRGKGEHSTQTPSAARTACSQGSETRFPHEDLRMRSPYWEESLKDARTRTHTHMHTHTRDQAMQKILIRTWCAGALRQEHACGVWGGWWRYRRWCWSGMSMKEGSREQGQRANSGDIVHMNQYKAFSFYFENGREGKGWAEGPWYNSCQDVGNVELPSGWKEGNVSWWCHCFQESIWSGPVAVHWWCSTKSPGPAPLQTVSWERPSTLAGLRFPALTWEGPTSDVGDCSEALWSATYAWSVRMTFLRSAVWYLPSQIKLLPPLYPISKGFEII